MYQFLLSSSEHLPEAEAFGLPLVHLDFILDETGRLRFPSLPAACRGGLMLIGANTLPEAGRTADRTAQAILSLCRQRDFRGVVLDLELSPTPWLSRLIRQLEQGLNASGRRLFLPERYGRFSSSARLYFSSALSGGSFVRRLEQMTRQYDPSRLFCRCGDCRQSFLSLPQTDRESL